MKRWDLTALPSSTEKQTPREPGADAPRVARSEGDTPRVLFSEPECRTVVVDLAAGKTMGDHQVHERAVVLVAVGTVDVTASDQTVTCPTGTLLTFEPGERHSVRATEDSRLVLLLTPWTGDGHVPENAIVPPLR